MMQRVRFLDPTTGEILHPDPLSASGDPIVPSLERQNLPTGSAVNPLLTPGVLQWDVRCSVGTCVVSQRQDEVVRLAGAATLPPTARLEIQSPQLPWRVDVRPTTPNLVATVHDVLAAIHRALGVQVTLEEWERFSDTRKHATLVARGHRVQGYDLSRTLDELYRHPRRVDTLGERTRFAGLMPAPHRGPHSYDLELAQQL